MCALVQLPLYSLEVTLFMMGGVGLLYRILIALIIYHTA